MQAIEIVFPGTGLMEARMAEDICTRFVHFCTAMDGGEKITPGFSSNFLNATT